MKYIVTLNGKDYEVLVEKGEARVLSESVATPQAMTSAPQQTTQVATGTGTKVPSPLAGLIVKTLVKPGDTVKAGQVLVILEAMKMENEIVAPKDAQIIDVLVTSGQNVNTNDPLVTYA